MYGNVKCTAESYDVLALCALVPLRPLLAFRTCLN